MKKNIAYIIQDFYVGGIPTFLYNLSFKLKEYFNFHFIASNNPNINPSFRQVGKAIYLGNDWNKMTQYLNESEIDLVQYGNCVEYKHAAQKANIPVIIERTAGPRSCNLDRSGINHVISSTKGTVSLIRKNYSGPISVIYNGVDLDQYGKIKPDRLHFKKDDFVVGYCARIGGIGQRFHILIKTILELRDFYDIKLILIGSRPKGSAENVVPELKKMAKPLGEDCKFTGMLLNPLPIIAGLDLYVCPAAHHGISNSIIDACAFNTPVIASNVGQTNEIVHHGNNGYLFKLDDLNAIKNYIVKLKSNPKKRYKFGQYGKDLVNREFNIDIQAKRYKNLYNELLQNV